MQCNDTPLRVIVRRHMSSHYYTQWCVRNIESSWNIYSRCMVTLLRKLMNGALSIIPLNWHMIHLKPCLSKQKKRKRKYFHRPEVMEYYSIWLQSINLNVVADHVGWHSNFFLAMLQKTKRYQPFGFVPKFYINLFYKTAHRMTVL